MKLFFEGALDRADKARTRLEEYQQVAKTFPKAITVTVHPTVSWRAVTDTARGPEEVTKQFAPEVLERAGKYLAQYVDAALMFAVEELEAEAERQLVSGREHVQGYLDRINEIEARRKQD